MQTQQLVQYSNDHYLKLKTYELNPQMSYDHCMNQKYAECLAELMRLPLILLPLSFRSSRTYKRHLIYCATSKNIITPINWFTVQNLMFQARIHRKKSHFSEGQRVLISADGRKSTALAQSWGVWEPRPYSDHQRADFKSVQTTTFILLVKTFWTMTVEVPLALPLVH